jgi:hypothetical protein
VSGVFLAPEKWPLKKSGAMCRGLKQGVLKSRVKQMSAEKNVTHLEAEGQRLALIPFLGMVTGKVADVMKRNFNGTPKFENGMHIDDSTNTCTTYNALSSLDITCNYCKKKICSVGVFENIPKNTVVASKHMQISHRESCRSLT